MSGHAYAAPRPRTRHLARRPDLSGPGAPLAIAALCVAGLAAVWLLANLVPALHYRDAVLLREFTRLNTPAVEPLASGLTGLLEPLLFILWGIAVVAVALARERPRLAVAVVAVMALAPYTAETLKPLLAHSHANAGVYMPPASWPSGHATAATALALSVVLVAPRRWRTLAWILAAAFMAAVGIALLIGHWHMPSDVIGGYLVGALWAALALAAVRASERLWPSARAD